MHNDSEILPQIMKNMSLANDKDEKYERLEDENGYIPLDPVKMNKSLEYEYMMKFEPWDVLPSTYFPLPSINHRPSLFFYGFGFRWEELVDFAIYQGLCPTREEADENSSTIIHAWLTAALHLARLTKSEFGATMAIRKPWSRKADVVLRLWDNYCDSIPYPGQEKMFDAIDKVEDVLKEAGIDRRPMWYISQEEMERDGYGLPIDFTHFFPSPTKA